MIKSAGPSIVFAGALGLMLPGVARAQEPPSPTGTIALEGTVRSVYAAANTVIVLTMDGVEHAFHFTKDLLVHGGKGAGVDALSDLKEGTSVVVHYTGEGKNQSAEEIDQVGDNGLKVTEGVVTRINRRAKRITVRFDNGTTEEFALTDRAAADAGKEMDRPGAQESRVVVYYSDERGQKVAHYFKAAQKHGG